MANGHGDRLELEPTAPLAIDTIRALFTYTLALLVVVGGGLMLYLTRNEAGAADLRIMIAGFVGSALTFAFGQEIQTRTARQAATATAANAAARTAEVAAQNSGVGSPAPTTPRVHDDG